MNERWHHAREASSTTLSKIVQSAIAVHDQKHDIHLKRCMYWIYIPTIWLFKNTDAHLLNMERAYPGYGHILDVHIGDVASISSSISRRRGHTTSYSTAEGILDTRTLDRYGDQYSNPDKTIP